MQRTTYQPPPPPPPPSPSRQNRVTLQREYREREMECFNMLRDIIKDITGEELRTRQEILRKSIDILLLTASDVRRQRGAQVNDPTATFSPTNHEGITSHITNYPTQSPYFPQVWQPDVLDATNLDDNAHFYFHDQDQQYYPMSGADVAPNQDSFQGHGQDWSNYH